MLKMVAFFMFMILKCVRVKERISLTPKKMTIDHFQDIFWILRVKILPDIHLAKLNYFFVSFFIALFSMFRFEINDQSH